MFKQCTKKELKQCCPKPFGGDSQFKLTRTHSIVTTNETQVFPTSNTPPLALSTIENIRYQYSHNNNGQTILIISEIDYEIGSSDGSAAVPIISFDLSFLNIGIDNALNLMEPINNVVNLDLSELVITLLPSNVVVLPLLTFFLVTNGGHSLSIHISVAPIAISGTDTVTITGNVKVTYT